MKDPEDLYTLEMTGLELSDPKLPARAATSAALAVHETSSRTSVPAPSMARPAASDDQQQRRFKFR